MRGRRALIRSTLKTDRYKISSPVALTLLCEPPELVSPSHIVVLYMSYPVSVTDLVVAIEGSPSHSRSQVAAGAPRLASYPPGWTG
jgi:hypothetical protein